jgi:hypothetical protein
MPERSLRIVERERTLTLGIWLPVILRSSIALSPAFVTGWNRCRPSPAR